MKTWTVCVECGGRFTVDPREDNPEEINLCPRCEDDNCGVRFDDDWDGDDDGARP